MAYYGWAPYVPVAERRRKAVQKMNRLRKKGVDVQPVEIAGRKIATTFWGQAWCDHIESFHDFENRLPRGRTYVRNGSVCHLAIKKGKVSAMVSGSEIYKIDAEIDALSKAKWKGVKDRSAGQIGSLLELLQGRLSDSVMQVVTDPNTGLFPISKEIRFRCNCFDWAVMCKHVAAVLYGVGARLDQQPELLFLLRGVKHEELVETPAEAAVTRVTRRRGPRHTLADDQIAGVFGIDLGSESPDDSLPSQAETSSDDWKASKQSARSKPGRRSAKKKARSAKSASRPVRGAKKKTAKKLPRKKKTPATPPRTKRAAKKKPAGRTANGKSAASGAKTAKRAPTRRPKPK